MRKKGEAEVPTYLFYSQQVFMVFHVAQMQVLGAFANRRAEINNSVNEQGA